MVKDNFSDRSKDYAKFRPQYPAELCEVLARIAPGTELVWDCGTGNGQLAAMLSAKFKRVHATDISVQQLEHATRKPNIEYLPEPAEGCSLPDHSCDLIAVAQAIHWFDFDRFYREVRRVAKPGAILAVLGYSLFRSAPAVDAIVQRFYTGIVGPYWDPERRWVDEQYQTIPFPFEEIDFPVFEMTYDWTMAEMLGYFGTWSATRHFIRKNGTDPVERIQKDLAAAWPATEKVQVRFEMLTRIGRIDKKEV